jgi:hypothetical protein
VQLELYSVLVAGTIVYLLSFSARDLDFRILLVPISPLQMYIWDIELLSDDVTRNTAAIRGRGLLAVIGLQERQRKDINIAWEVMKKWASLNVKVKYFFQGFPL